MDLMDPKPELTRYSGTDYQGDNWSNGFMSPLFQGTVLRPKEPSVLNLDAPPHQKGTVQRQNLQLLEELNLRHLDAHPGEADLEARIASYELAARSTRPWSIGEAKSGGYL